MIPSQQGQSRLSDFKPRAYVQVFTTSHFTFKINHVPQVSVYTGTRKIKEKKDRPHIKYRH